MPVFLKSSGRSEETRHYFAHKSSCLCSVKIFDCKRFQRIYSVLVGSRYDKSQRNKGKTLM